MALSAEELTWLDDVLNAADAEAVALAQIRQRLQGVSLTRCDPYDVRDEIPFRSYPRFELHLIDGRSHCWQLTGDPACATGLVIAPRRGSVQ